MTVSYLPMFKRRFRAQLSIVGIEPERTPLVASRLNHYVPIDVSQQRSLRVPAPLLDEPGRRLYVCHETAFGWIVPLAEREFMRDISDYEARLVLSHPNGRAHGVGIRVLPPEGALEEAIAIGLVHPSLVAEPGSASEASSDYGLAGGSPRSARTAFAAT